MDKDSILKSSFFKKLFVIPSICLLVLGLLSMISPEEPMTCTEFIIGMAVIIIIWFVISFVITLIINEIKKDRPKAEIFKEVQYITKSDDKITIKSENMKEESKKELRDEWGRKNNKYLYACENILDKNEYTKMAMYFPEKIYWFIVSKKLVINVICTFIIAILLKNWIFALCFFTFFLIYILIFYKIKLESLCDRGYTHLMDKGELEINVKIEFYEDYLIRKSEKISMVIDYSKIGRCGETDNNFYLEYTEGGMVLIVQKNRCDLELVNFIRNKFKNSSERKIQKIQRINIAKILMIILFIVTILSLWGALWTIALVDQINPQHGFNFIKNTWIFWCWLPIPIASIILGFRFKSKGLKCTKNIVAGFIVGLLLLIYGAFSLLPTFSQDYSKLDIYKDIIDASLPNNGELEIQNWEAYFDDDKTNYTIINAYYDKEDVSDLVNSIETSSNWILSKEIKSELKILIPSQLKPDDDAYYSIYNKTNNQYNMLPKESGNYEIYAMKYDKSDKHLEIHKFDYLYK